MSKTVEIQIEKSRGLVEGLRRHVKEMGERGVTNDEIADHFFVYLTFGRVCSRSAKSKRVCFCPRLLAYFALTIS